jgi:gamma-glutamyltranspeptidase/glutathione hydrolase
LIQWRKGEQDLKDASPNYAEMLLKDPNAPGGYRGPRPGEVFRNENLARTFRALAKEGKKGFYTGRIAEAIIKVTKDRGGCLELEDLKKHMELGSEPVTPISLVFKGQGYSESKSEYVDEVSSEGTNEDNHGVEVWEHPPNGQGIVALMALGILEALEETGKIPKFKEQEHNSVEYLHALIESLRIAFADASWFIADPNVSKVPPVEMISKKYHA